MTRSAPHRRDDQGPTEEELLGYFTRLSNWGRWGPGDSPGTVHAVGIVAMGMPLLDNADLEDLARQCEQHQRWDFFFALAPLPVAGSTSSAVNPLAIF